MVLGDQGGLGDPGDLGCQSALCLQQQGSAGSLHSPCLLVSAGNTGRLGECLARGQDFLLGQEGLVDQGAPSLQGARVAPVVPRDLEVPLGPSLLSGPVHLWNLEVLQVQVVPSVLEVQLDLWVFSSGALDVRWEWRLAGSPRSRLVGCSAGVAGHCLDLKAAQLLPARGPWPPAWSAVHSCR